MQGLRSCLRVISWAEQWPPTALTGKAPSGSRVPPPPAGSFLTVLNSWSRKAGVCGTCFGGKRYNCYVEGIGMAKQREERSQGRKRGKADRDSPRHAGTGQTPDDAGSLALLSPNHLLSPRLPAARALLQLLITAELTSLAPSLNLF